MVGHCPRFYCFKISWLVFFLFSKTFLFTSKSQLLLNLIYSFYTIKFYAECYNNLTLTFKQEVVKNYTIGYIFVKTNFKKFPNEGKFFEINKFYFKKMFIYISKRCERRSFVSLCLHLINFLRFLFEVSIMRERESSKTEIICYLKEKKMELGGLRCKTKMKCVFDIVFVFICSFFF